MFKAIATNLTPSLNRFLEVHNVASKSKDGSKEMAILSAESITLSDFTEIFNRYPALIKKISESRKDSPDLEELDRFRYVDAPARYSVHGGNRPMVLEDLKKLCDWKLKHGKFRPGLQKHVASNSEDAIKTCTGEAFELYSRDQKRIGPVLSALSGLKGIGPATSSLILAIHDPDNVVYFSDECYKWLVSSVEPLKYTTKEYEELDIKAKDLMGRLGVTPLQVEKVAFVLIKENEPAKEKASPKTASGRPRGRPRLPEEQKKKAKSPSGKPRGRPRLTEDQKKSKPVKVPGRGRGRPKKAKPEDDAEALSTLGRKRKAAEEAPTEAKTSKKSKAALE